MMNSSEKANLWCLGRREKKEEYRDLTSFLQRVLTVRLFFYRWGFVPVIPFSIPALPLYAQVTSKSYRVMTFVLQ